ncbi:MAG TPA: hypothetical protein VEL31_16150, partial [Ktedonobacteraceae bacterium]|nr:hypothetical protein [Ktedonobacteraceae bacterium]
WRGCTIQLSPRQAEYYVYLIHFTTPYKHARHYLGSTCFLDERLAAHANGSGARLMEVVSQAGITWELARLWPCESEPEMRQLEKYYKHRHNSGQICPSCNPHLPPNPLAMLRAGHYPFHVFDKPGKRMPIGDLPTHFVRK